MKIINKLRTISNIIDFVNDAPDGLMERDSLVRTLLGQCTNKKLKQLEEAYFNNMDAYNQDLHKEALARANTNNNEGRA